MRLRLFLRFVGLFFFLSGCTPGEAVYQQTNTINIVVTNVATSGIPKIFLIQPTNGQIVGTIHDIVGQVLDDGDSSQIYAQTGGSWRVLPDVTLDWHLIVTNGNVGAAVYRFYAVDQTGEVSPTNELHLWISNTVPSVSLEWGGGFETNTNILTLNVNAFVSPSGLITNLKIVNRVNGIDNTNDLSFGGLASEIHASYPITLVPNAVNEVRVLAYSDGSTIPGISPISTITADQESPVLALTSPSTGETKGFVFDLSGTINDNFGLGSLFVLYHGITNEKSASSSWTVPISNTQETNNFQVSVWATDAVGNKSAVKSLTLQISNIPGVTCDLPDYLRTNTTNLSLNVSASVGSPTILTNVRINWGTNSLSEHIDEFSTNVSSFQISRSLPLSANTTNLVQVSVWDENGRVESSSVKKVAVDTEAPFFSATNLFVTNDWNPFSTNVTLSGVVYDNFHGYERVEVWKSGDYRLRDCSILGDSWSIIQTLSQTGVYTNRYRVSDGFNFVWATNVVSVFVRPLLVSVNPNLSQRVEISQDFILEFSEEITNTNDVVVSFNPSLAFTKVWSNQNRILRVIPTTEFEIITNYQLTVSNEMNADGIVAWTTNLAFQTALDVPNGSFEYGTLSSGDILDGSRTNWEAGSGSTSVFLTNVAADGNRSFWWSSLSTTARDEWSEFIPAAANTNYRVSLDAYQPAGNPLQAQVAFQIQYYHADQSANTNKASDVSSYTTLTNGDVWNLIEYNFTTPPETAFIRVRFKTKTSATTNSQVGIDNLHLYMTN